MNALLASTEYIDKDHPSILEFVNCHTSQEQTPTQKAINLFYNVRDKIRYNPYSFGRTPQEMRASHTLKQKEGYCVAKAVLLCACLRAAEIPSQLGFADVKNHLSPAELKKDMGTDIFVYHGYTYLLLDEKWIKATPAFNLDMCRKFNFKPTEFNGKEDAMFHFFDNNGNHHMEYIKDRGISEDLPLNDIIKTSMQWYPGMLEQSGIQNSTTYLNQ